MAPRLATQQAKGLPSKHTTTWDAYLAGASYDRERRPRGRPLVNWAPWNQALGCWIWSPMRASWQPHTGSTASSGS
jgi:hypothetical protein